MSLWAPIKFDQETIEAAVALCAGLGGKDVSAFMAAVHPLAHDDVEARHDLARVAFQEVYKRRTPCWVYFATVDGTLLKVGRSTAVAARLQALSRQRRVEHKLLGSVRGDYREERRAHYRLRKHRIKNLECGSREYYELDPVIGIVREMIAAGKVIDMPPGRDRP